MPTIDPPKIPRNTLGLRDAKRALRERVLRERDQMPEALHTAAGQAIAATLMARPDFTQAQTVLVTLPFGSEWDTRPLLSAAVEQGKTVVMPRVNSASRMLELYAITDPHHDVAPGFGGIPEPQAHCPAVMVGAIDWVLVPGVVFDTSGSRIGYGGGYYDRLLPCCAWTRAAWQAHSNCRSSTTSPQRRMTWRSTRSSPNAACSK